jgi:hypothetical protein
MKHRECVLRLTRRPYFDRLRFSNGRHSLARVRAVAQRKLPFGNHGFCWKTQSTSRLRSGRKSRETGLRRRLPPLVHCHMFLRCRDSRLRCVLRQRHYALKSTTKSSAGILEHKMHSRLCNSAAVRTGLGRRVTKLQRAWTRMGGAGNLAMVGAVAAFIPEYFRRNFRDFAGSPAISGIGGRERGGGGQHGRSGQHRERFWKGILGLGVRFDYPKSNIHRDVSCAGDIFLDSPQHQVAYLINDSRLLRAYVLWRRIWGHACLYSGLLWIEECRSCLWSHAHRLGFRERFWAAAHCLHATDQWHLSWCAPCDRGSDGSVDDPPCHRFSTPAGGGQSSRSSPTTQSTSSGVVAVLCGCVGKINEIQDVMGRS